MQNDPIAVRKASIKDIGELCDIYLGLSLPIRRLFHPFPFSRERVRAIFLIMLISDKFLNIIKKLFPSLGLSLLVAYDNNKSEIVGFVYFHIIGRQNGILVANLGITVRDEITQKGIGSRLMQALLEDAKKQGIGKMQFTALADNKAAIALYRKFGSTIIGETDPDYWNGKYEKNLLLELYLS